MKKIFMITMLLLLSFGCIACGQEAGTDKTSDVKNTADSSSATANAAPAVSETAQTNTAEANSSTIVVYFSQTGTTAAIGDTIADILSADKYVIEAKIPYTAADLNYNDNSTRATVEQRDSNARPEIAGVLPNLSSYDTVYIGYPIWWGQAPKIMYTFVENCDLSGKKVIPFCVSAQTGIGDSARILSEVSVGKADWREGRRFSAGTSRDAIKTWIDNQ